MQFEYDPEQLIEEVKKRPALWNMDDPDYRSKHVKMKMWTDIVKELMSEKTADITRSEMRELELQLQKKWKSLRDCYQKYISHPNKSRRPYVYNKQLQFLGKEKQSSAEKRKPPIQVQGSSGESEEDERPKTAWKTKKILRIPMQNEVESDDHIPEDNNYEYEMPMKAESELRNVQVDQFAFANVASDNYEDTDKMFLMSLLPHLKSIPEEFRLNVKVELMNVLRTAHDNTSKFRYGGTNS